MPDRTISPSPRPFGPLVMPPDTVEHLGNGAVFHRYIGGDQPICRLQLCLPGGQAEMGPIEATLFAACLDNGTALRKADDIADLIDFNGARMQILPQNHYINIGLRVLSSHLPQILPVIGDIITGATFPDDRFGVARSSIRSAIDTSRHKVSTLADFAWAKLVYGEGHFEGYLPEDKEFDAVAASDLRRIHRGWVTGQGVHAFLSGAVDDEGIASVRRFLESLPSDGGIALKPRPYAPAAAGTRTDVPFDESRQCAIVAGCTSPRRDHADYVPLRYAIMALGGYFGSRLMTSVREERGLTYGISAALLGSTDGTAIYVRTQTDRSTAQEVIDLIGHEIGRLATEPPEGAELERLRRYASTQLAELLDSPDAIMSHYSGQVLVGTTHDYFQRQQDVLTDLTPDTISAMASKYFTSDRLRTATAGA